MIIQSDSIQAHLSRKAQAYAQDSSRHLLCPTCRVRTKLYALKDGRKKCSACGAKFDPDKKTDALRLRQCADILLCFCINFTAQQASMLSGYRYRLVAALYDDFRVLLARQTLDSGSADRLSDIDAYMQLQGGPKAKGPVFGVRMREGHRVLLEPLFAEGGMDAGSFGEYAGYISDGTFQRFAGSGKAKDGADQMWAWMSERLKRHHGIWKRSIGLYLKELEWKFNHRELSSEAQAVRIADLMPEDFLATWGEEKKGANAPEQSEKE